MTTWSSIQSTRRLSTAIENLFDTASARTILPKPCCSHSPPSTPITTTISFDRFAKTVPSARNSPHWPSIEGDWSTRGLTLEPALGTAEEVLSGTSGTRACDGLCQLQAMDSAEVSAPCLGLESDHKIAHRVFQGNQFQPNRRTNSAAAKRRASLRRPSAAQNLLTKNDYALPADRSRRQCDRRL